MLSTREILETFVGFLPAAGKAGGWARQGRAPCMGWTWTGKTHEHKGWRWAESDPTLSPSGKGTEVMDLAVLCPALAQRQHPAQTQPHQSPVYPVVKITKVLATLHGHPHR